MDNRSFSSQDVLKIAWTMCKQFACSDNEYKHVKTKVAKNYENLLVSPKSRKSRCNWRVSWLLIECSNLLVWLYLRKSRCDQHLSWLLKPVSCCQNSDAVKTKKLRSFQRTIQNAKMQTSQNAKYIFFPSSPKKVVQNSSPFKSCGNLCDWSNGRRKFRGWDN